MSPTIKLIIFDMDGTLTPQRPSSTAPFERVLLPGVAAKCSQLRQAGIVLTVASNQGGGKRTRPGRLTFGAIQGQMAWLRRDLGGSAVRYSISRRKKPNPAMLIELIALFGVSTEETIFMGDAETDRQAAEAAGVQFIYASEFLVDVSCCGIFTLFVINYDRI